jgi:hypothetical protein
MNGSISFAFPVEQFVSRYQCFQMIPVPNNPTIVVYYNEDLSDITIRNP